MAAKKSKKSASKGAAKKSTTKPSKSAAKKKTTKKKPAKKPAKQAAKKSTKKTTKRSAKKTAAKKKSTSSGASSKKKAAKTTTKSADAKAAKKKTTSSKAGAKKSPAKKAPARAIVGASVATTTGTATAKATRPKKATKSTARRLVVAPKPPKPKVEQPPLSKRISKRDLATIRDRLLARRMELVGSLEQFNSAAHGHSDHVAQAGGDVVDQATFSASADLSLRMAESEYRELRDIDLALGKLEDGSYGLCEVTGEPIDVRRLLFMPAVRLSIEAQKQLENNQIYHDEERGWVRW